MAVESGWSSALRAPLRDWVRQKELLEQATRRLSLDRRSAPTDTDVNVQSPDLGCTLFYYGWPWIRAFWPFMACLAGELAESESLGPDLMVKVMVMLKGQCLE